jgi:hypothetical protein
MRSLELFRTEIMPLAGLNSDPARFPMPGAAAS